MTPPGFDEHLGLGEAVEDLPVEQFVTKRPVEALVVSPGYSSSRARRYATWVSIARERGCRGP